MDNYSLISFLVPGLPLLGFLIQVLFGKRIPEKIAGFIASGWIVISFFLTCALFMQVRNAGEVDASLGTWFSAGGLNISFSFLIDHISIIMMLVITGVGSLIHIYSIGYMHGDDGFNRFFGYLNLFVFFMLLLVMADNYVLLFVGWEGVGLCSYLLIGFWFKNEEYNNAAKKAFIMNRIGDLAMLIGLFLLFNYFGSLNFKDVFSSASSWAVSTPTITAITLLLFVGATGKSAQIPLYTWLPDAMAGPTPVSALIHAATMVTAGIYLIVRSHILFTLAPVTMDVILITGLATSIFAATIGLKQNDIKKVLAYSTVSQLGLMFFGIGVGSYEGGFFHLVTHAFFKALLFLAAGSVIHGLSGEQDIRKMGGLRKKMPVTHFVFLVGTLAICALPPFSGFFSKDQILLAAWEKNPIWWGLGMFSGLLTVYYMFRLYFVVFTGETRADAETAHHIHESPNVITIPLLILALLSFAGGVINLPGSEFFGKWIGVSVENAEGVSATVEILLMVLSVVLILYVVYLAARKYRNGKTIPESDAQLSGMGKVLSFKYYIDEFYDALITRPLRKISDFFYRILDLRLIDGIVNGTGRMMTGISGYARLLQTGTIGFYLFAMAIGVAGIIIIKLIF